MVSLLKVVGETGIEHESTATVALVRGTATPRAARTADRPQSPRRRSTAPYGKLARVRTRARRRGLFPATSRPRVTHRERLRGPSGSRSRGFARDHPSTIRGRRARPILPYARGPTRAALRASSRDLSFARGLSRHPRPVAEGSGSATCHHEPSPPLALRRVARPARPRPHRGRDRRGCGRSRDRRIRGLEDRARGRVGDCARGVHEVRPERRTRSLAACDRLDAS